MVWWVEMGGGTRGGKRYHHHTESSYRATGTRWVGLLHLKAITIEEEEDELTKKGDAFLYL